VVGASWWTAACLGQRVSVIGLVMTNEDGLFRRRYTIRMAGRFIVCAGKRLTCSGVGPEACGAPETGGVRSRGSNPV
jgi:hypothetical protein